MKNDDGLLLYRILGLWLRLRLILLSLACLGLGYFGSKLIHSWME